MRHEAVLGRNSISAAIEAAGGGGGVEKLFLVIRANPMRKQGVKFFGDFISLESNSKSFEKIKIFLSLYDSGVPKYQL